MTMNCFFAPIARFIVAVPFAIVCNAAFAQSASHLSDADAAPPSRWAPDAARVDEQIRFRVLSADDPRSHWIAGLFDTTDIASKVRNYATARVAAPQETLYIASLALACLQPVQPALPECDAVDRLADWATRDADNGLPTMLLAARASKRGDNDGTIAYLELAATKPRFDEYDDVSVRRRSRGEVGARGRIRRCASGVRVDAGARSLRRGSGGSRSASRRVR